MAAVTIGGGENSLKHKTPVTGLANLCQGYSHGGSPLTEEKGSLVRIWPSLSEGLSISLGEPACRLPRGVQGAALASDSENESAS